MNGEDRREEHGNGSSGGTLEGRDDALLTEVLVASLEPADLPEDGWERLRAGMDAERGGMISGAVETTGDAAPSGAQALGTRYGEPGRTGAAVSPTGIHARASSEPGHRPVRPAPTSARRWPATAWAAFAVLVFAVGGTLFWGYQQAAERARLQDDQRILAYWMSNPGMRLTSLTPAAGTQETRLGVLCVLPDGRALVLQPAPAGRGATYIVLGRGPDGVRELTRGSDNMLQFDASGVDMIELRLASADDAETLAWADLN